MSTKEKPPPRVPKLKTLNKGLKLAEQWVKNMTGEAGEEAGECDLEARPAGLGLGAKVLRNAQFTPSNPVERSIQRHLGLGRKKPVADEKSRVPAKSNLDSDEDDDEKLESRTNAFAKKRAGPQIIMPPAKKKSNRR